jgi:hypothetical protein
VLLSGFGPRIGPTISKQNCSEKSCPVTEIYDYISLSLYEKMYAFLRRRWAREPIVVTRYENSKKERGWRMDAYSPLSPPSVVGGSIHPPTTLYTTKT